jgi:hypothetical protein
MHWLMGGGEEGGKKGGRGEEVKQAKLSPQNRTVPITIGKLCRVHIPHRRGR